MSLKVDGTSASSKAITRNIITQGQTTGEGTEPDDKANGIKPSEGQEQFQSSSSSSNNKNETREPHDNDVLCGRGGSINTHPGNENFRRLVERRKRVYVTARFKREKRLVASSIVSEIRNQDPPGRFLSWDPNSGVWFDIGDEKARGKTSHALRGKSRTTTTIRGVTEKENNKIQGEAEETKPAVDSDDENERDEKEISSDQTNQQQQQQPQKKIGWSGHVEVGNDKGQRAGVAHSGQVEAAAAATAARAPETQHRQHTQHAPPPPGSGPQGTYLEYHRAREYDSYGPRPEYLEDYHPEYDDRQWCASSSMEGSTSSRHHYPVRLGRPGPPPQRRVESHGGYMGSHALLHTRPYSYYQSEQQSPKQRQRRSPFPTSIAAFALGFAGQSHAPIRQQGGAGGPGSGGNPPTRIDESSARPGGGNKPLLGRHQQYPPPGFDPDVEQRRGRWVQIESSPGDESRRRLRKVSLKHLHRSQSYDDFPIATYPPSYALVGDNGGGRSAHFDSPGGVDERVRRSKVSRRHYVHYRSRSFEDLPSVAVAAAAAEGWEHEHRGRWEYHSGSEPTTSSARLRSVGRSPYHDEHPPGPSYRHEEQHSFEQHLERRRANFSPLRRRTGDLYHEDHPGPPYRRSRVPSLDQLERHRAMSITPPPPSHTNPPSPLPDRTMGWVAEQQQHNPSAPSPSRSYEHGGAARYAHSSQRPPPDQQQQHQARTLSPYRRTANYLYCVETSEGGEPVAFDPLLVWCGEGGVPARPPGGLQPMMRKRTRAESQE